jgi:hypothetical protein
MVHMWREWSACISPGLHDHAISSHVRFSTSHFMTRHWLATCAPKLAVHRLKRTEIRGGWTAGACQCVGCGMWIRVVVKMLCAWPLDLAT